MSSPFKGPYFGRPARLATAYDKTIATVATSVISSWNGNSGIPPPPDGAVGEVVATICVELVVEVVDEVVLGVVLVDDVEALVVVVLLVVVVEVLEVVEVVLVVVVVEVVVVLATGAYMNVVVFQIGFMLTEPLHEALTVYVPLIQLLVPPAPNE